MICLLGDIHGMVEIIFRKFKDLTENDTVIQVGDFGFYQNILDTWNKYADADAAKFKTFAIEGNHEDFRIIRKWSKTEVTEVGKNLFFVPRGQVLTIEGKRIGFLGGAESVDKAYRFDKAYPEDESRWSKDESITQANVDRLIGNAGYVPLDLLVTHAPPSAVIAANFPRLDRSSWHLPADWVDVSANYVQAVRAKLQPTFTVCGHMHKSVIYDGVRILDINEAVQWPAVAPVV